jgi:hypothetical protein
MLLALLSNQKEERSMKVFEMINFLYVFIPWYNWYSKFLTTKNALNEFKLFFIRTFSRKLV